MDWRRPGEFRRPEPPKPPARSEPPKPPAKPPVRPEPPKPPVRPEPPKPPAKPDDRNAEIEKKLDRLLKEIEDIRKEIRRPSR